VWDNIVETSDGLQITIETSKTDLFGKDNFFFLIPRILSFPGICPLTLLNSYKSKIDFLACNGRVWRTWNNSLQKFVNSPMDINSIAQIPQKNCQVS
jgi:hypothetical protein